MLETLQQLDLSLFFAINRGMGNGFFDAVLPWCRSPLFWSPLYLFLAAFAFQNFSRTKFLYFTAGLLLTILVTDTTSSKLIKKNVQRLRPCNTHLVQDYVDLRLPYCGSGYSFPSSHASNHFAMAMYFSAFFVPFFGHWSRIGLFFGAFLVAFAQVYVGVHYPFDVLFGAVLGSVLGWLMARGTARMIGQADGIH